MMNVKKNWNYLISGTFEKHQVIQKPAAVAIALLIVTILLGSCSSNTVYNETVDISPEGWYKDEAAAFAVTIEDTVKNYNFYLTVRNTTDYRYSNLFIFLNTILPNNNKTRDTIELVLADYTGKWLGNGWGSVKENNLLLKKNLRFPLKGEYRFFIQQAMRTDTLKGIRSVGLRLETTED